jgi:uncharacterized protein
VPSVRALSDEILPALSLRRVDARLHDAALTALLAADWRQASLVDWVSFELMRRDGIRRAFTFDGHFAERSFEII